MTPLPMDCPITDRRLHDWTYRGLVQGVPFSAIEKEIRALLSAYVYGPPGRRPQRERLPGEAETELSELMAASLRDLARHGLRRPT